MLHAIADKRAERLPILLRWTRMSAFKKNPWAFVPLLYFMQAVPVTIVQEVATVFYKDLGIANDPIVTWTSLISLPWSLQLLLGPLVDLNGTKRRWILSGQFLIAIGLILSALLLHAPHAFELSLLILGTTAVTSALCNIATDGFYIISMSKEEQAKFVGVQTTCYRLGRLFCTGLLVLFVGLLTRFSPVGVTAPAGQHFLVGNNLPVDAMRVSISQGFLSTDSGDRILGIDSKEIATPSGVFGLAISSTGTVTARRVSGEETVGQLGVTEGSAHELTMPAQLSVVPSQPGMNPALAWSIVLAAAAGIYFFGHLANRKTLPRPDEDRPAAEQLPGENQKNVFRTLILVGLGVGGYFLLNSVVRLVAFAIYHGMGQPQNLKGWELPAKNLVLGFDLGIGPMITEWLQLILCGVVVAGALVTAKRLIVRTPLGDALGSFFRQPKIGPIFCFILFYRFGEAMVSKMSPLFLKDSVINGGLAVPNEQLGMIKGVAGVLGIVCGGLVGGWVVGKLGLRKAFWPIALTMHLPNLLYLWASVARPPFGALYFIDFTDQFGYGFGFAGYMVYIMWVAQRGHYKTSHYAIATGMGALCIALAGMLSGKLQQTFGYTGFFTAVIFLSLPGLLTLLFIPLDEPATAA